MVVLQLTQSITLPPNALSKPPTGNGYPLQVHQMFRNKLVSNKGPKSAGVWSPWSEWTPCSRSCGGGITQQIRHCVSKPVNAKIKQIFYKKHKRRRRQNKIINYCVGLYKRLRLCNTLACPNGHDFRVEQCAAFNNRNYKGKSYNWEPYLQGGEECALNCLPIGSNFYATLNKTVEDGTSCQKPATSSGKAAPIGTRGVCIDGICKSVGTNGVIGAIEDVPEECTSCALGNCRSISGLYTRPDLPPGYSLVAQIPQGACRILVQQLKQTKNILALRSSNGTYVLNGDWQFSNSRIIHLAGTQFTYRKQDTASLESISTGGPTDSIVDIMVFYQQPNPGIKYGYSLPIDTQSGGLDQLPAPSLLNQPEHTSIEPKRLDTNLNSLNQRDEPKPVLHPHRRQRLRRKFIWKVTGVSACSKSCGGGTQQSVLTCVRDHTQVPVVDRRCLHQDKPLAHPIRCNVQDCPPHWGGHWGVCEGVCGEGTQKYQVICLLENNNGRNVNMDDTACPNPKPIASGRPCPLKPCNDENDNELHQNPLDKIGAYGEWTTGGWSSCSVSCGTGSRTRSVSCTSGRCRSSERPTYTDYCDNGACVTTQNGSLWLLSEWSQCSEACGTGTQSRYAFCAKPSSHCDHTKPEVSRACSSDKECGGQWFTGPWLACSDSCNGTARQKRDVYCIVKLRGQARITTEKTCPAGLKPEFEKACSGYCRPNWFVGDWGACENCPSGIQRRDVKCMTAHGQAVNGCDLEVMPLIKRSCVCPKLVPIVLEEREKIWPAQDEPIDRSCVDKIRNCYLAVQARLCLYPYYTTHCCTSCKRSQQELLE